MTGHALCLDARLLQDRPLLQFDGRDATVKQEERKTADKGIQRKQLAFAGRCACNDAVLASSDTEKLADARRRDHVRRHVPVTADAVQLESVSRQRVKHQRFWLLCRDAERQALHEALIRVLDHDRDARVQRQVLRSEYVVTVVNPASPAKDAALLTIDTVVSYSGR